jgi:hypothetical protein
MKRHEEKDAIVIPVILTPCEYGRMPFFKLNALPRDGKAITQWRNRDEVLHHVAEGVRNAANAFFLVTDTTAK